MRDCDVYCFMMTSGDTQWAPGKGTWCQRLLQTGFRGNHVTKSKPWGKIRWLLCIGYSSLVEFTHKVSPLHSFSLQQPTSFSASGDAWLYSRLSRWCGVVSKSSNVSRHLAMWLVGLHVQWQSRTMIILAFRSHCPESMWCPSDLKASTNLYQIL